MTLPERTLLAVLGALLLTACQPMENLHPDIHGHRGFRGKLPENSIPGFIKALEAGSDLLELDVVLSADGQVVVSHEPWMSARICLLPDGSEIMPTEERELNLYRMTVAEIQAYDCGSRPHPDFPEQERMSVYKPTLQQVVEALDEYALFNGFASPSFNIEIKSDPSRYDIFQPRPKELTLAVIAAVDLLGLSSRCILQSFDPAILEAAHAERPDIMLALLVENDDGLTENLERLSFKPHIYSPQYGLVDRELLRELREADIELVVWTVNEKKDIRRMLELGVDGIISDYPDRVAKELDDRE